MNTFKIGEFVEWSSQAGGVWKVKHGIVVGIVKGGDMPCRVAGDITNTLNNTTDGSFKNRVTSIQRTNHDRYVIAIPQSSKNKSFIVTLPMAQYLKKSENQVFEGDVVIQNFVNHLQFMPKLNPEITNDIPLKGDTFQTTL